VFLDHPGGEPVVRSGSFSGRIATSSRGTGGFGYDPIFEPRREPPGGRTVGQLSTSEKGRLSHRGKAARSMARALRRRGWAGAR
jgi:XTP/dITP diphosphohydrolase